MLQSILEHCSTSMTLNQGWRSVWTQGQLRTSADSGKCRTELPCLIFKASAYWCVSVYLSSMHLRGCSNVWPNPCMHFINVSTIKVLLSKPIACRDHVRQILDRFSTDSTVSFCVCTSPGVWVDPVHSVNSTHFSSLSLSSAVRQLSPWKTRKMVKQFANFCKYIIWARNNPTDPGALRQKV